MVDRNSIIRLLYRILKFLNFFLLPLYHVHFSSIMIPAVSWSECSPQSSAARRLAEQRVDKEANDKKAEKADSTSLATAAVKDNTSACQAGADPEGKEAQCSAQTKSSGRENKETKKPWTSARQKTGGIFDSWDHVKLQGLVRLTQSFLHTFYLLFLDEMRWADFGKWIACPGIHVRLLVCCIRDLDSISEINEGRNWQWVLISHRMNQFP